MSASEEIPRVGVGVFILNDKNDFIFGRRKGSHGAGTWALPGGHLEYGESFEECANREVLEETGLRVESLQFLTAVNSVLQDSGKHYVTIFMVSKLKDANDQPQLLEPQKCEGWHWISWKTMLQWYADEHDSVNEAQSGSQVLFLPMKSLVEQRTDIIPKIS